jgi:hypothetical protein
MGLLGTQLRLNGGTGFLIKQDVMAALRSCVGKGKSLIKPHGSD